MSPKFFFRSITSITLLQAPFHDFYKQGYQADYDDIDERHGDIRHHELIAVRADVAERDIEVERADERDDRCLLDKSDELVAEGRENVLYRLRDDYAHHRGREAQSHASAALHLTVVNALDTASHYLRYVRAAVKAENRYCHADRREIDAHYRQHDIVEYKQLHDHGGSSEERDIECADGVEYSREDFVFRYNAHGRYQRTDDNTDYKTENGYLERILQALQDFYIAVVVYEYLDKLIDFLR